MAGSIVGVLKSGRWRAAKLNKDENGNCGGGGGRNGADGYGGYAGLREEVLHWDQEHFRQQQQQNNEEQRRQWQRDMHLNELMSKAKSGDMQAFCQLGDLAREKGEPTFTPYRKIPIEPAHTGFCTIWF